MEASASAAVVAAAAMVAAAAVVASASAAVVAAAEATAAADCLWMAAGTDVLVVLSKLVKTFGKKSNLKFGLIQTRQLH